MMPIQALTTVLGGVSYYVHPQVLRSIKSLKHLGHALKPAVVLSSRHGKVGNKSLVERLNDFAGADDVYNPEFGRLILMQTLQDAHGLQNILDSDHLSDPRPPVSSFTVDSEQDLLPEGPYFILEGNIHQAWRMYPDELDTFIETVIPNDVSNPTRYSVLQTLSDNGLHRSVAVPSRLYSTRSKEKPLAGLRISLKDNIRLAGVKTTMMNRAYADLYPPEAESAAYASRIAALGGVIVGKTKMCSFASAEEPTDQWVDYHCPFNPRGDLYQSPSGSTTGGGASLAGYDWLDYSIGTDTSGSIRSPAAYDGLFSLRSTFGSGTMNGIVESCRLFDTIGILSRSVEGCHYFAKSTLELNDTDKFPQKILYPLDFFPQVDAEQQKMTDIFVSKLEEFLGVKKTEISLAERWDKCPPPEAGGKPLREYIDKSGQWPMYWYTYHAFDDFRADYERKFGKPPYVGPYMQVRWGIGEGVSVEDRDRAVGELEVFRKWFTENVMPRESDSPSDIVIVMPFGSAKPQYRDEAHGPPSVAATFNPFYFSPVLELPQMIIPIGQKKYESKVSKRDEYLPIVSSLVGGKGSDLMLSKLAAAVLNMAKWPASVKTGRFMFELGDNERNTADQYTAGRGEGITASSRI